MKTMTVREIRHQWPAAEKAVVEEGGVIVTRDTKPVAQIIPFTPASPPERPRFNVTTHLNWLKKISKNDPKQPWVDDWIRESRKERNLPR